MKVTVEKLNEREIKYPCLMELIDDDRIVLFTKSGEGVVVSPRESYDFGKESDCWSMGGFTPFRGRVILEG